MAWTTLHLEVTTPLFNGGADTAGNGSTDGPPDPTGIRVPSLRGAMRFWFRALAGMAVGPDLRLLAALEREVFGGTDAASPVKLRMPEQPKVSRVRRPDFIQAASDGEDLGKWVVYLLGQGLTKLDDKDKKPFVSRPFVAPGEPVKLQLRFTGKAAEATGAFVLASLWLLCAYGGLGARTRRGFGGLRILRAEGDLPAPWNEKSIVSPGLDHYERLSGLWLDGPVRMTKDHHFETVVQEAERKLGSTSGTTREWLSQPSYPVLGEEHTNASTTGGEIFNQWEDVLAYAGEQLRWFRASRPNTNPRAKYDPKIKTREWTEVITGAGDHFGLGALGLPVGYKDGYVVNADRDQRDRAELLRRASPLWLRPVGRGQAWRLLSFAFLGEFLPGPDALQVHVWRNGRQGKPVTVNQKDVTNRTKIWIRTMGDDGSFKRKPH